MTGSADPGPSPTVSIGCKMHGDHWDCDEPAHTAVETSTVVTSSAAAPQSTGAGNALSLDYRFFAAGGILSVGLFLIGI